MENASIVLKQQYRVSPLSIHAQQGGWSALAYKVTTVDDCFFLKIYEKSAVATAAWTAHIQDYMPILVWLNESTALKGRIPRPILTVDGDFMVEDDQRIYLLFEYIDGITIADQELTDVQVAELAGMISELHAHGAEVPCPTHRIREDFAVPFCAHLKRSINQNQADHPADLRSILAPHRERLTYLADRTESLADRMKAADPAMQLCHTDAHGWNLMQNRYLMLIDWEGLKLAPVEADLFMFYDKPFWERFLSVYRKKHPRFVVSLDAMDFYLNRRRIEDIWEFIDRILHDPISSDLRDKSMQLLEKELVAIG